MWIAFFNNIPELLMWGGWSAIAVYAGMRIERSAEVIRRAAACALLALVACNDDPKRGRVVGKRFESAHTDVFWVYGGQNAPMIPSFHDYPDRWWITITEGERMGHCLATREEYDAVQPGTWLDCDPQAKDSPTVAPDR